MYLSSKLCEFILKISMVFGFMIKYDGGVMNVISNKLQKLEDVPLEQLTEKVCICATFLHR